MKVPKNTTNVARLIETFSRGQRFFAWWLWKCPLVSRVFKRLFGVRFKNPYTTIIAVVPQPEKK